MSTFTESMSIKNKIHLKCANQQSDGLIKNKK